MCISTFKWAIFWHTCVLKKMHFSFYYWKKGFYWYQLRELKKLWELKQLWELKTTTRNKTTAGLRELKQLRLVLPRRFLLGRRLPGRHLLPQLLLHLLHTQPLLHLLRSNSSMATSPAAGRGGPAACRVRGVGRGGASGYHSHIREAEAGGGGGVRADAAEAE